jgi:hypothetical protein
MQQTDGILDSTAALVFEPNLSLAKCPNVKGYPQPKSKTERVSLRIHDGARPPEMSEDVQKPLYADKLGAEPSTFGNSESVTLSRYAIRRGSESGLSASRLNPRGGNL